MQADISVWDIVVAALIGIGWETADLPTNNWLSAFVWILCGGLFFRRALWIRRQQLFVQFLVPLIILVELGFAVMAYRTLPERPTINAYAIPEPYLDGTNSDGLTWSSSQSDLRVHVLNPNDDQDYSDVHLRIDTDLSIWRAIQTSKIPDCSVSPEPSRVTDVYPVMKTDKGETVASGRQETNTASKTYFVSCPKLPRKAALTLTLQAGTIQPPPDPFWGPRALPRFITVTGDYEVNGTTWTIKNAPRRELRIGQPNR
jgi:hypothetical protein